MPSLHKERRVKTGPQLEPTETGKVACYVLAAMAEGKPIDATFTIEGVDLKIEDGTKVYHGCILLTPENIDEYDYS